MELNNWTYKNQPNLDKVNIIGHIRYIDMDVEAQRAAWLVQRN